jgi:hypothetical protein
VAELADALDSGSSERKLVQVRVLPSAPKQMKPLKFQRFFNEVKQNVPLTFCDVVVANSVWRSESFALTYV